MKRAWVVFAALLLLPLSASADTLVLRSGQNKKGRVVHETDKQILFDSQTDGAVIEVQRSDISILDRDPGAAAEQNKGSVSFFTTSEKKKKRAKSFFDGPETGKEPTSTEEEARSEGKPDQAAMFGVMENYFQDWLKKNPEMEKFLSELVQKFKGKSEDFDQAVEAAKQQA